MEFKNPLDSQSASKLEQTRNQESISNQHQVDITVAQAPGSNCGDQYQSKNVELEDQSQKSVASQSNANEVPQINLEAARNAQSNAQVNLTGPKDGAGIQSSIPDAATPEKCGVSSNGSKSFVKAGPLNPANQPNELASKEKNLLCGSKRLFN